MESFSSAFSRLLNIYHCLEILVSLISHNIKILIKIAVRNTMNGRGFGNKYRKTVNITTALGQLRIYVLPQNALTLSLAFDTVLLFPLRNIKLHNRFLSKCLCQAREVRGHAFVCKGYRTLAVKTT